MKIGIVSSEYPPMHGGGISTYAVNAARALAEAGHEVYVVANRWHGFGEAPIVEVPADSGATAPRVLRLDVFGRNHEPRPPHDRPGDPVGDVCRRWGVPVYWSLHSADAVEDLHRRVGLDVVEFPECLAEAYVTLRRRAARPDSLDLPVVLTLHSPSELIYQYNLLDTYNEGYQRLAAMEGACIRGADALISPSTLLAQIVRARFDLGPNRPVEIIPYPMDFASVPVADPPASGPPTLLFVGRVEPRKGCKTLVDAAVRVMAGRPDLKVRLVGRDCEAGEVAGSFREFLLGRIPEGLRANFAFEGLAPRERVLRQYGEAIACVFPAPWDNYPYTCCEAMAAGACVIASANSGMAEMIEHGVSGLLFQAEDVDALAEALRHVLDDRPLRDTVRRNARPRVRSLCDPRAVALRKLSHYERTIDEYRRVRRTAVAPATRRARVAVFLAGPAGTETETTIASVREAAASACIDVGITTEAQASRDTPAGGARGRLEDRAFEGWLGRFGEEADYLMRLDAGARLGADYFRETLGALTDDRVAWATTWARPAEGSPTVSFAGTDFFVPMELMYHHPIPFAIIRADAYRSVGGWNFALPGGWREWDLWLAFRQGGWEGVVVPRWSADYRPSSLRPLEVTLHPDEHRRALGQVVRRNHSLIAPFAAELWMNLGLNPLGGSPGVNRSSRQFTRLVRQQARILLDHLGLLGLVRRALGRDA